MSISYISTRGSAADASFEDVVRQGLAPDGGLFVPLQWPRFNAAELKALSHLPYIELAQRIMQPFVGDALAAGSLAALAQDGYSRFAHPDITPLISLDERTHLLELFHGPTLAFKDVALQLLGRFFGHFTYSRREKLTVVGATSGDTGSAAIEGCRGIEGVRVFILYPHNRPSEVQRRQMTCVDAPNVHALAIEGSFDDCQNLVKQLFNDPVQRAAHHLTAVNSINWARIMAQIVYYFYAGFRAGALQQPVNFVVPTGNFGNIYAGFAAKQMGLPVGRLVIATNSNDSLVRFVNSGAMQPGAATPSLSPSMDIQIASNAERYVFELLGHDGTVMAKAMKQLKAQNGFQFSPEAMKKMREEFLAVSVSDEETLATMKHMWGHKKKLVDPHSAVGLCAVHRLYDQLKGPIVSLACAHPAKFPETVLKATGQKAELPEHLADLYRRKEKFTVLPNDYAALTAFIGKN